MHKKKVGGKDEKTKTRLVIFTASLVHKFEDTFIAGRNDI